MVRSSNVAKTILLCLVLLVTAFSAEAFSWTISNTYENVPGIRSTIDWPSSENDKLNFGEYVNVQGVYYSVVISDYCDGVTCPAGNVFADLQECDQSTGAPLEDPMAPGIPLYADLTGTEGEGLAHYPVWPDGYSGFWSIASVPDPPGDGSVITWFSSDHEAIRSGEYVKVQGVYYSVAYSSDCGGGWCPEGDVYTELQECDQSTGAPLEDPMNPGRWLLADLTGMEGEWLTYYPVWPDGHSGFWSIASIPDPPGDGSVITWYSSDHEAIRSGEYVKVQGVYYSVAYSSDCGGGWCPEGDVYTELQQCDQSTGAPLEDPMNPGRWLLADLTGMEGEWVAHYPVWPDGHSGFWSIASIPDPPGDGSVITWFSSDHDAIRSGEYVKVQGVYYSVVSSYDCGGGWCPEGDVYTELQQCDQSTGAPLEDPMNPGRWLLADLTGMEGEWVAYYPVWPDGHSGFWSIASIPDPPGDGSVITWYSSDHEAIRPGEYVKVQGVYYSVAYSSDCGGGWCPEGDVYTELQQCDQSTGAPLEDPMNPGRWLLADLTGMEGEWVAYYPVWPDNHSGFWSIASILDPPGDGSMITWLSSDHEAISSGEYVKVQGTYYSVVYSADCDGGWCPAGNVYAELQECDQLTGASLEDPVNPGWPLLADLTGLEGEWVVYYPTWPLLEIDIDLDGYSMVVDCNDNDPLLNPGATEIPYNGIDENCSGMSDDDDLDSDGYGVAEDCDDTDPLQNPGATEVPYNGIDENCSGMSDDDDLDSDGYGVAEDCNDTDPLQNPGATEIPYNGIDENCSGMSDDDDLDSDGYGIAEDCNDTDPLQNPGATEIPYNGIDENCSGMSDDDDLDSDGYGIEEDCDDNDALKNPGTPEIKHDGVDQNCTGYDLTIEIIKADYRANKDRLKVEATSSLGASAGLEVLGYGVMSWDSRKQKWTLVINNIGGDPGFITVSGIEGQESTSTY